MRCTATPGSGPPGRSRRASSTRRWLPSPPAQPPVHHTSQPSQSGQPWWSLTGPCPYARRLGAPACEHILSPGRGGHRTRRPARRSVPWPPPSLARTLRASCRGGPSEPTESGVRARSNNQRSRGSRTKLVTDTRRSTIETATTPGSPASISSIRGGHHGHANLFHFDVPVGRWHTVMVRPVSAANAASSVLHSRVREPHPPGAGPEVPRVPRGLHAGQDGSDVVALPRRAPRVFQHRRNPSRLALLICRIGCAFMSAGRSVYGHAWRLRRPGTNTVFVIP